MFALFWSFAGSGPASKLASAPSSSAPAAATPRPKPVLKTTPIHKSIKLRTPPKATPPRESGEIKPVVPVHTGPATNSTVPADQVLASPIIPKF